MKLHSVRYLFVRLNALYNSLNLATGCTLTRTNSAKDYGPSLTQVGFKPISSSEDLKPGDVRIIESISGHPHGHMQAYVGQGQWASDFKQNGEWPGPAYRNEQPNYTTYRYSK